MLGFDADERGVQQLTERYSDKVIWGSRYPHHDTTSAWEAIETLTKADVPDSMIARMLGGNAAQQYGVELAHKVSA